MKTIFIIVCVASAVLVHAQAPGLQWARPMGGRGDDQATAMAVDSAGNVITAGYFSATADFDPSNGRFNITSQGKSDLFISKLDANGNFIWARHWENTNRDSGGISALTMDEAGNVYAAGYFTGTKDFDPGLGQFTLSNPGSDIFILKLDKMGNFVWAKQFEGSSSDLASSIAVDKQGNVYTTGNTNGMTDFDPDPQNAFYLQRTSNISCFVSKLDSSGNFVYANVINSLGYYNLGYSIVADNMGNAYATGIVTGNNSSDTTNSFISKFDPAGNVVWIKKLATGGSPNNAITLDRNGNVYTTGYFWGTINFDVDNNDHPLTTDNGALFLLKMDSAGNFLWANKFPGSSYYGGGISAIDASGYIYTMGLYGDGFFFTPEDGPGPDTIGRIYYAKTDMEGHLQQKTTFDHNASIVGRYMGVDSRGGLYVSGTFFGTQNFALLGSSYSLTLAGQGDVFVMKLDQNMVGIDEPTADNGLTIFPNPTSGLFNVTVQKPSVNTTIEIYNSLGALVHQQVINGTVSTIDLTNEANGLYVVKLRTVDGVTLAKVLKD